MAKCWKLLFELLLRTLHHLVPKTLLACATYGQGHVLLKGLRAKQVLGMQSKCKATNWHPYQVNLPTILFCTLCCGTNLVCQAIRAKATRALLRVAWLTISKFKQGYWLIATFGRQGSRCNKAHHHTCKVTSVAKKGTKRERRNNVKVETISRKD